MLKVGPRLEIMWVKDNSLQRKHISRLLAWCSLATYKGLDKTRVVYTHQKRRSWTLLGFENPDRYWSFIPSGFSHSRTKGINERPEKRHTKYLSQFTCCNRLLKVNFKWSDEPILYVNIFFFCAILNIAERMAKKPSMARIWRDRSLVKWFLQEDFCSKKGGILAHYKGTESRKYVGIWEEREKYRVFWWANPSFLLERPAFYQRLHSLVF